MRETSNPSDIWIRINIHETTHIFHDRLSGISRVPSVRYILTQSRGRTIPSPLRFHRKSRASLPKTYIHRIYLPGISYLQIISILQIFSRIYPRLNILSLDSRVCKTYFIEFNLFEFMKYYRSLTIKTRWLKFFSTGEELFSNLDSKLSPSFLGNG